MKVLIYQQFRNGDVLQSSFIPFCIKNVYPEAIIDFCCDEKQMYLLEGHPALNKVFPLDSEYLHKTEIDKQYYNQYDIVLFAWVGYSPTFNYSKNKYDNLLSNYITLVDSQMIASGFEAVCLKGIFRPYVADTTDKIKDLIDDCFKDGKVGVVVQDTCYSNQTTLSSRFILTHVSNLLKKYKNRVVVFCNNDLPDMETVRIDSLNLKDIKYIFDKEETKFFFHTDSSFTNLIVANKPEEIYSFSFSDSNVGIREFFPGYTGNSYDSQITLDEKKMNVVINKIFREV